MIGKLRDLERLYLDADGLRSVKFVSSLKHLNILRIECGEMSAFYGSEGCDALRCLSIAGCMELKEAGAVLEFSEKWKQEDMGSGAEGWIAGVSENGSDAIMVMQMAKNIYGTNIADMDNWKDMINASYPMSEMTSIEIDNPSVPGMDVAETYRCSVTVENITGEGRILYGETEYAYYSILYVAVKMNAADEEYFNNVCASFKEAASEIGETAAAESTDTIQ